MASATTIRQLITQIKVWTRTKVSDERSNYFSMKMAESTIYLGHSSIATITPVSFTAVAENPATQFFSLTLVDGRSYYIDDTTAQGLIA